MTKGDRWFWDLTSLNAKNLGLIAVLIIIASCSDNKDRRISNIENGLLPITTNSDDLARKASIAERMNYYDVPGLSVAVFDSGELVWTKGYGVGSKDQNVLVDKNTLFQAASISKPVTAVGALLLVQQGQLSLENDVNDSLNSWQLQTNGFVTESPVTLRGLLNHSAGVTVHGFHFRRSIFYWMNLGR